MAAESCTVPHLEVDAAVPVCSIQEAGFRRWRLPREIPPGREDVFADLFDVSGERLVAKLHSFKARPWLLGFSRMRRRRLPSTSPRVVAPTSTAHPCRDLPPRQRLNSSTRWRAGKRLGNRPDPRTREDLTIRRWRV